MSPKNMSEDTASEDKTSREDVRGVDMCRCRIKRRNCIMGRCFPFWKRTGSAEIFAFFSLHLACSVFIMKKGRRRLGESVGNCGMIVLGEMILPK